MRKALSIFLLIVMYAITASAEEAKKPAVAEPISGRVCLIGMKNALEPSQSFIRNVVITSTNESGAKTEWIGRQVYKQDKDGRKKLLLVMTEPEAVKGIAYLYWQESSDSSKMWVYVPAVRRVRSLGAVGVNEPFLGTDFTYSDIGLIQLPRDCDLVEIRNYDGVPAYKVEEKAAAEAKWYYSRIVTWINTKTFLPMKRDYYDPAGTLWKTELFKEVTTVDNVATPLLVQMKDLHHDLQSDIKISNVKYRINAPDTLFEPSKLSDALNAPFWKENGY